MARWRKHLFIATSYMTADAADYFGLPPTARWSWVRGSRSSTSPHRIWKSAASLRGS